MPRENPAFIDGTVQSSGSNIRHNVIVESDIGAKHALKLGETATIKKDIGNYVQQIKLDDGIYELDYQKNDMPKAFSQGNVVNHITTENHTIEFDGSTDQIKISDSSGYLRVILGKIGTAGNYGLKINNISGSELFGLYGTTANIAGWTVDTDHLLSSDGFTNINSAGHIVLGNPSTTDVLKLSGVADDDYRIWVGNISDTLAPFRVHKDGSFYSVQGTIGGWSIGETMLKSDTGYGRRIQLDKSENRISIFDGSNTEKVAMGYLDELLKSNGIKVGSTTYTSTTMKDDGRTEAAENAWEVNELAGLYIEPVGKNRVLIISNTFDTITVTLGWGGQDTPSGDDDYRIEFGSQDYGFWVLPGDRLQIDGDVTYEGGDWLIQHDASLRIVNGDGLEVIRLGTDTGEKGLFLYDGSAGGGYPAPSNTLAKFHTTGIQLGPTATEYMAIAVGSITMYDGGSVRSEWKDGYLSLGGAIAATDDCIIIKATEGVKIYDNSTDFLNISSTGLAIHAGDASNAVASFGTTTYIGLRASEHMKLTVGSMELKSDDSTTMMALSSAGGGTITMGGKIIINSAGTDNVCIGVDNVDLGTANISLGIDAGASLDADADNNVFIGKGVGQSHVAYASGNCNNVGIGFNTFNDDIEGFDNVAIGSGAMQYAGGLTGTDSNVHYCYRNVAIGTNALELSTGAAGGYCQENIAIGFQAMGDGAWGSSLLKENVAIGDEAGKQLENSYQNTLVGRAAGGSLTTGNRNTCIGMGANVASAGSLSAIVLGSYACVSTGNYRVTIGKMGLDDRIWNDYTDNATWARISDVRFKKDIQDNTDCGLDFINDLRPVTFKWKSLSEKAAVGGVDLSDYEEIEIEEEHSNKNKMYGLIAQEVKASLEKYNITDFGGWNIEERTGFQGIAQSMFIYPLIKSVQELSAKVEALESLS